MDFCSGSATALHTEGTWGVSILLSFGFKEAIINGNVTTYGNRTHQAVKKELCCLDGI